MIEEKLSNRKIQNIKDLLKVAKNLPPKTVVLTGADMPVDLQPISWAVDEGIIKKAILVGSSKKIAEYARQLNIDLSRDYEVISASTEEEVGRESIRAIKEGGGEILLKGHISTPIYMSAILDKEGGLHTGQIISQITLAEIPEQGINRLVLLTDPGVNTVYNYGKMVQMVRNAAEVANLVLGIIKPRVAVISANDKIIPSLKSTLIAKYLTEKSWQGITLYGPLSYDLAIDSESAIIKGLNKNYPAREVAGKADVLLAPNMDCANIIYKSWMESVKHGKARMANIVLGAKVPFTISSRSDPALSKFYSIALCSIFIERKREQHEQIKISQKKEYPISKKYLILTINPGSTSTKVALFENMNCLCEERITNELEPRLARCKKFSEQYPHRMRLLKDFLRKNEVSFVDAIVGRGGFLSRNHRKIESGVYQISHILPSGEIKVNERILHDIKERTEMEHPSNLGIPMAAELSVELKAPAFTVDAVVVDEFSPLARVSGFKGITRKSVAHVLSIKQASKEAREKLYLPEEFPANFIVSHLGAGITVAAVANGQIVDSNIAFLGDGPFTPERVGTLPLMDLIDLYYNGGFTKNQLIHKLMHQGGAASYLGTSDFTKIEQKIRQGNKQAKQVIEAMIYNVAKQIGSMFLVLRGEVEAIVITGDLAKSKFITDILKPRISILAPVMIFPGSREAKRMVDCVLKVLTGREILKRY